MHTCFLSRSSSSSSVAVVCEVCSHRTPRYLEAKSIEPRRLTCTELTDLRVKDKSWILQNIFTHFDCDRGSSSKGIGAGPNPGQKRPRLKVKNRTHLSKDRLWINGQTSVFFKTNDIFSVICISLCVKSRKLEEEIRWSGIDGSRENKDVRWVELSTTLTSADKKKIHCRRRA